MTPVVIVDKIGEVVASMRNLSAKDAAKFGVPAGLTSPYYFYGRPVSINSQMIARDHGDNKGKVYPAIAFRLPSTRETDGSLIIKHNLNIAILDQTERGYDEVERYENVIKPILYPLYYLFLDRLKKAGFIWDGPKAMPPHKATDKPHHGIEDAQGNKAYIFERPLEAIEIENLRINYNFNQC